MQRKRSTVKARQATPRPWNDRGIRRAARDLGVCYSHLSRVLSGERNSQRLLSAYQVWRRDHAM